MRLSVTNEGLNDTYSTPVFSSPILQPPYQWNVENFEFDIIFMHGLKGDPLGKLGFVFFCIFF